MPDSRHKTPKPIIEAPIISAGTEAIPLAPRPNQTRFDSFGGSFIDRPGSR
jgi:hypothetical protein